MQAAQATAQQAQAQSNAAVAAAAAAEGEAACLHVSLSELKGELATELQRHKDAETELLQQARQQQQLLKEEQVARSRDVADLVRTLEVSRQEAAELAAKVSCFTVQGRIAAWQGWS